jgi:hypothetical protein
MNVDISDPFTLKSVNPSQYIRRRNQLPDLVLTPEIIEKREKNFDLYGLGKLEINRKQRFDFTQPVSPEHLEPGFAANKFYDKNHIQALDKIRS